MDYLDSSSIPDYRQLSALHGRGYVVLGAGDGIGRQTVHALSQSGAKVLCVDRDGAAADRVAKEVRGVAVTADVTSRADVERVVSAAVDGFGDSFRGIIDIVGMALIGPLASCDDETWTRQFDLVLRHAYLALQVGGAVLARTGGGTITLVGSISGVASVANQLGYGSAKAALHHLVRCAAHELGRSGVRVNAVSPSYVRTPRLLKAIGEETWNRVGAANPLGRVALPSEVASAILFLASDLSSYVNGHVLSVDGGVSVMAALPEFRPG